MPKAPLTTKLDSSSPRLFSGFDDLQSSSFDPPESTPDLSPDKEVLFELGVPGEPIGENVAGAAPVGLALRTQRPPQSIDGLRSVTPQINWSAGNMPWMELLSAKSARSSSVFRFAGRVLRYYHDRLPR